MNAWAPFLVIGLTTGSVYAMAGLGLVLTYRTSGIFNFSYGAIAAAAAYLYYELHVKAGVPTWMAVALVVLVAGPSVGFLLELVARGLNHVSATSKMVATIGLLLGVEALLVVLFGAQGRPFPRFLPTSSLRIVGVHVGVDQMITMGVGLMSVVAIYALLRRARTGVAMRAVVESPDLLGLTGTSPPAVRRTAWIIGASFAGVSGLLLAPTLGLDPLLLTLLVVQAFSAAAIGAFSSLPWTYAGGILVGLVYAFAEKIASGPAAHLQWVQGLPASTPFLVLFLVLLLMPPSKLRESGAAAVRSVSHTPRRRPVVQGVGAVIALAAAVMVPWIVGVRLPIYTNGLAFVVVFASLGLLVRTSGQISLAHIGFAAVGGAVMAHLAHGMHVPWLVALLLAGLCAVPIGVILAVPAIRLSGLYLALATFGFGILLANLIYPIKAMFGPFGSLLVPRPEFGPIHGDSRTAFYFVALAIAVAALACIVLLERSRLGRLLRGLSDSPLALTTRGTNVNVTRVLVFAISAFLAAIGGALYAASVGFVSVSSYPWFNSLVLLAVLITVGPGTIRSPVIAAVAYIVVPSYISSVKLVEGLPILFGVSAILVAMRPYDFSGLKGRLARKAAAWEPRAHRSPVVDRLTVQPPVDLPAGDSCLAAVCQALAAVRRRSEPLERVP